MEFYNQSFLSLLDYSKEEIEYLIDLAIKFKKLKEHGKAHNLLKRKNIALVFEKESNLERCAFEVAIHDLGMNTTYLKLNSQKETRESITNNHQILEKMYDGIVYYGTKHKTLELLLNDTYVPIINGTTDKCSPIQALATLMTIKEHFKTFRNQRFVYCGDGNCNIASSLMIICSKLGLDFVCCSPKELWPKMELVKKCQAFAQENHSILFFDEDIMRSTQNATVVYTAPWINDDEKSYVDRLKILYSYQVNKKVINNGERSVVFMHLLPHLITKSTPLGKEIYEKYGIEELEVTSDVFNSYKSKVINTTENYMHITKAVICATLYDTKSNNK